MQTTPAPRIYVACLAAYNNGHLHGEWIDAAQDVEIIREEIHAILATSPIKGAEEYAIHDSEDLGHITEYASLDDVALRAEFIAEHGEVALALLDHHHCTNDAINAMDNYHGEYDSELDFIYHLVDEQGMLDGIPSDIAAYFDYESYARDQFINGYYSIKDGRKCYVFSNN